MKVAVLSFSGNVGKSTIAHHLLAQLLGQLWCSSSIT